MSFLNEALDWLHCEITDTQYYGPIEGFKLVIRNDDYTIATRLGDCSLERLPEMLQGIEDRGRFDTTKLYGWPIYRHHGLDEYHYFSFEILKKRYC